LVRQIGGPEQPGIGFGIGLERLLIVMEKQGVAVPTTPPPDVYFVALGERAHAAAANLLFRLREAGFSGDKDYLQRNVKPQMKAADRSKARFAVIIGEDELARGELTVKHLRSGEQTVIPMEQLTDFLREK